MADTYENPLEALKGYFWGNDPNINQQLRQRIAMQMMSQRKAHPKNVGEGLSAIGDALGDIGMARKLEQADLAAQAAGKASVAGATGARAEATPATEALAYAPDAPIERQDLPPPAAPNAGLLTAPPAQQPSTMLAPQSMARPGVLPAGRPSPLPADPRTPLPADPRDRVAAQLLQRDPRLAEAYARTDTAQEVPQPNPTMAGPPTAPSISEPAPAGGALPDQRLAQAPGVTSDIAPAPVPSQIRALPRQVDPGYVTTLPPEPAAPAQIPMSALERRGIAEINKAPNNPYVAKAWEPILAQEKARREFQQSQRGDIYKGEMVQRRALQLEQEKQRADQAKRVIDFTTAQQEQQKRGLEIGDLRDKQVLQARLGGQDPEKFFTTFREQKTGAEQASNTLETNRMALDAIKAGVVTGWGADFRINTERLQAWALKSGKSGDLAANTQILRAALTAAIGSAVRTIQGEGGVASNTDVKLAERASGADPTMELGAIQALLNSSNRINARKVDEYEDQRHYYLGGTRAERAFQIPTAPTAPQPYIDRMLQHKDNEEARKEFDDRFGAGAAHLEIARAKRRQRRGE